MCIKLARHFRCSAKGEHVCQYLIRCSNPTFAVRDLSDEAAVGPRRSPCFEERNLEILEEWYEQRCPDCTGQAIAPDVKCVRRKLTTVASSFSSHDEQECRDHYFRKSGEVEDTDVVSVYVENLAYWLFSYIYSPKSTGGLDDPFGEGAKELKAAQVERRTCMLNELVCQVNPQHGGQWNIIVDEKVCGSERWEELELMWHDEICQNNLCDCSSAKRPWLSNWARHIRRGIASDVYVDLVTNGNPELAFNTQERFLKKCAVLQKPVANSNNNSQPSSPGALALPLLDVVHRAKESVYERARILEQDAKLLTRACRELPDFDHDQEAIERHKARASLLSWARFVLTHDSGLSIARSRQILALFAGRVVRHDIKWQASQTHQAWETDACKRLAQMANKHPAALAGWVAETLSPLKDAVADFDKMLHQHHADLKWQNRLRTGLVWRNIAAASAWQLDEIQRSKGERCAFWVRQSTEKFASAVSRAAKRPAWILGVPSFPSFPTAMDSSLSRWNWAKSRGTTEVAFLLQNPKV